jgi:hypothetical protein
MIYLHNRFHIHNPNVAVVITTEPEATYRFMLFFYIVPKEDLNKVACFSKIHTSFHDPILSGASVSPTSQINMAAMMLLSIVGWGGIQWHKVHTKFHENRLSG